MVSITGESRLCALFCRADADPNLADDRLFRPIHWACVQGHKTVVRILINHGADLRLVNEVMQRYQITFAMAYTISLLGKINPSNIFQL